MFPGRAHRRVEVDAFAAADDALDANATAVEAVLSEIGDAQPRTPGGAACRPLHTHSRPPRLVTYAIQIVGKPAAGGLPPVKA